MRSSNSCGGTEIWVDMARSFKRSPRTPPSASIRTHAVPFEPLVLLDPYHLRPPTDHLVALHRLESAADGVLMGRIGDQNDRHRRSFAGARRGAAIGMALHDRFDGNLLLREP